MATRYCVVEGLCLLLVSNAVLQGDWEKLQLSRPVVYVHAIVMIK
jgi:hypothetical protein